MQDIGHFHSKKIDEVFKLVHATSKGLTSEEVEKRQTLHGKNELPEQEKISQVVLFFRQFRSVFIYILVIAAGISYFFDKTLDAYIIIAIILLNAIIGYVQESRAEHAIRALQSLIVPKANALRNAVVDALPAEELVIGDIILLQAGDRVPADARIVRCRDFSTQEASLTGESFTVQKDSSTLPDRTHLAERANMVWMGTLITSGTATGVVVATGIKTALGLIASSIKSTVREKTHFRKKTGHLALQLGLMAGVAAVLTFVIGFWVRNLPGEEVFIFSVASLVSSIPEGLPAVLAIVLAIGAYRMAQKKAIVRHLPIIEDLSVASVIMTDKTGTLTQNTMTARRLVTVDKEFDVSGEGWEPTGKFYYHNEVINPLRDVVLEKMLRIAVLCNNASLHKEEERYEIIGDPTEASFIVLAKKAALSKEVVAEQSKVLDQLPFSQATRTQSVLVEEPECEMYVIGSDETIMKASSHYLSDAGVKKMLTQHRETMETRLQELTHQAMRVVACASRRVPTKKSRLTADLVQGLTFIGFIGIADPIRPEATEAIADARRAGIRVIMATGDHADTAAAIGRQVGLIAPDDKKAKVYTEQELHDLSKRDLKSVIQKHTVFARMTPTMKMNIITMMQDQGKVVAMIGDGVNDAPALKKANVGIAMGNIGTDVAREAADIILSDDNFATLIKAIEQGRLIFNNIRQTSFFMITTSVAEIVTIVASLLIGSVLPLTAIQILWINLITDGIPNVALATEREHDQLLDQPPRSTRETILSKEVLPYLLIIVLLMSVVTLTVFKAYLPYGEERARTAAFTLLIFFQLFNVLNMRSLDKSLFKIGVFSNPFITGALLLSVVVQVAMMYIPVIQSSFGLVPLSIAELTGLVVLSMSVILFVELYKMWRSRSITLKKAEADV